MENGAPSLEAMTPQEKRQTCPPLTPITPFHLNFQQAQETPTAKPSSIASRPLLIQPQSPSPTKPPQPLVTRTSATPATEAQVQDENVPPTMKQAVLIRPKTPKTPRPPSLPSDGAFEPFLFELLGRLRYPKWHRLAKEINGLDPEEVMRVFAFFLALYDEGLGFFVGKGGFSAAFNHFKSAFRQVGFQIVLTKRNFLQPNKKPVLPYIKMICDKVIQKYGGVEELCRSKRIDYLALLERYQQEDAKPPSQQPPVLASQAKKRRRKSVPNSAMMKSDVDPPATRKIKRRRKSDATGLMGVARTSSSSASGSRTPRGVKRGSRTPRKSARQPRKPKRQSSPVTTRTARTAPLEPSPQAPEPTAPPASSLPLTLDQDGDTAMESPADPPVRSQPQEQPCEEVQPPVSSDILSPPTDQDVPAPVDESSVEVVSPSASAEASKLDSQSNSAIEAAANRANELLIEKDMTIQEKAAQINQLDVELTQKTSEIQSLSSEKVQIIEELELLKQSLTEEREKKDQLSLRLEVLETEKAERELEKKELWEKIAVTSEQYQSALRQKEEVIKDLINQVSSLKLQLGQKQQELLDFQREKAAADVAMVPEEDEKDGHGATEDREQTSAGGNEHEEDEAPTEPEKISVVQGIDFGAHVESNSLQTLKVVDLKKYLKANDLKPYGKKVDLVRRIKNHYSS